MRRVTITLSLLQLLLSNHTVLCDHWSIGQLGNHNPSFFPGRPLVYAREDCDTWEDQWATRVTDGDGQDPNNFYDSYQQSLRFEVQAERPGLFEIQPAMTDGRGPICPFGGANPANPYVIPGKPQCERGDLTSTDGTAGPTSLEDRGGISLLTFKCRRNQCGCSTVSAQLIDDGVPDCMVGGNGGITSPTRIPFCPGGCNPDVCTMSLEQWFTICITCVNDCPSFDSLCHTQVNEDETNIAIANWAYSINKGAPNEADQAISFTTTTSNPSLFTTEPYIEWDPAFPSTGTLRFDLRPGATGTSEFCVTIRDNGGVAEGGCDQGNSICCTIKVLPINDCPRWVPGRHDPDTYHITVDEDAGQVITQRFAAEIHPGGDGEEVDQNLWFNLVPLDPTRQALFVEPPSINPDTGDLRFEALSNVNSFGGDFKYYVQLQDDGGRVPPPSCDLSCDPVDSCPILTITIVPKNDPPRFTPGPDIYVCEDAKYFCYPNWATQITPGTPREGVGVGMEGQIPIFTTEPDNPDLFEVNPAVDATTGTLCFTLRDDANGVANTLVTITDTGPENMRVGTKAYVRINVKQKNDPPSFQISSVVMFPECIEVSAGSGETSIQNFIRDISRGGGPNEASQNLRWIIDTTPVQNFESLPEIRFSSPTTGDLHFTPSPNAHGSSIVTVSLKDDGGVDTCGGSDTKREVFCINIVRTNIELGPLDIPDRICVREDAPGQPHRFPMFFQGLTPGCQNIEISTPNVTHLFSALPVVSLFSSSVRELTFATAPDQFGTAYVAAVLVDSCNAPDIRRSEPKKFEICIRPCNDRPTFDLPSLSLLSTSVTECDTETASKHEGDCCPHIYPNFAMNIAPGPDNEAGQKLTFTIDTNSIGNDVFREPPRLTRDGVLSFCLNPNVNTPGVRDWYVTLQDDGGRDGGCEDRTVTPMPFRVIPVNTPPTFIAGVDMEVNEDVGTVVVENWARGISPGVGSDEQSQTLQFSCVPNDLSIIRSCAVSPDNGRLTFTTQPDAFGDTFVTVTLDDGEALSSASRQHILNIKVNPVNDQPSFTSLGSVVSWENTCYSLPWVVFSTPGPANEAAQVLTYLTIMKNTNENLFKTLPAIDQNGVLTYCPTDNAHGTAELSVRVKDDGGTARGGTDTSEEVLFTITVLSVNNCPVLQLSSAYNERVALKAAEDAGEIAFTHLIREVSSGPYDERAQDVSLTARADPTSAFTTQPFFSFESADTGWTLAPDFYGGVAIFINGHDDGPASHPHCNTSTQIVMVIVVDPVNDPPTFTPGPAVTTVENAPGYVWPSWAQNITRGPPNEDYQRLRFTVTAENRGLFEVQPSVSIVNGDLSFKLNPNTHGLSKATVCLSDGHQADDVCITTTITVKPVEGSQGYTLDGVGALTITVLEDAGSTTIQKWIKSEETKLVNITTPGQFHSMFVQNPVLFESIPDYEGAIPSYGVKFHAKDNVFGTAELVLVVGDADIPFKLQITPVNDPPSFELLVTKVEATQSGSPRSFLAIANVTAGPGEDGTQTVSFAATSNPSDVVTARTDGARIFLTPKNKYGSGNISVVAKDSKGLEAVKTLSFVVSRVNHAPTFTPGPLKIQVDEDVGQVNIPWATGVSDPDGDLVSFTVEIPAADMALFDMLPTMSEEGRLSFTMKPHRHGTVQMAIRAWDSPGAGFVSMKTDSIQVVLEVRSVNDDPVVGVDPVWVAQEYLEVLEDSGETTFKGFLSNLSAGGWMEDMTQHLQVTVTPTSPGLFAVQPKVEFPGKDLTLTPALHQNGETVLSTAVVDALGGRAEIRIPAVVVAVNDPPIFYPNVLTIKTKEDSGFVRIANWASDMTPGPQDEQAQKIVFMTNITEGPLSIISSVQVSSKTGQLDITLNPDMFGIVVFSIKLHDDGGTLNGGRDASDEVIVTVDVQAVNDPPSFTLVSPVLQHVLGSSATIRTLAARNISPGPFEGGQGVSFIVSVSNQRFFASHGQPVLTPDGQLTFAASQDRIGNVTLEVIARDTENAVSAKQAIHITMLPPSTFVSIPFVIADGVSSESVQEKLTSLLGVAQGDVLVDAERSLLHFKSAAVLQRYTSLSTEALKGVGITVSLAPVSLPPSTPLPTARVVTTSDDSSVAPLVVLILIPAVFLVVTGVAGTFLYRHWSGKGAKPEPQHDHQDLQSSSPSPPPHDQNPIDRAFPSTEHDGYYYG
eukprot:TRINITY_DN17339_c0_g1_i1.p1 TRINITY_DN17339_c0_g1~~TRINITY_DN17339_c0_g1_i1.p1  ORF type:complete len:2199 (+),score=362.73 TRINITY_DN17339_c0_g1_i1:39-6599(+)